MHHTLVGQRFIADFRLVRADPAKGEAQIAFLDIDGREFFRRTVDLVAFQIALENLIISVAAPPHEVVIESQAIAAMHGRRLDRGGSDA